MDLRNPSPVWSKLCEADTFCGWEKISEYPCILDFKLLPLPRGDFLWIVGYDKELGSKKRKAHKVDLSSGETVLEVDSFPPSPLGTMDATIDFFLLRDSLHVALLDIDLSLMKYDEEKREWTMIEPLFGLPEECNGVPRNEFEVRDVDCHQNGGCIWFQYQICHEPVEQLDEDDYTLLPYFHFLYATDGMGGAWKLDLNETKSPFPPAEMINTISLLDYDKMKFVVWYDKQLKVCDGRFRPDDDRFTEQKVNAFFDLKNVDRAEWRRASMITYPHSLFVLNKPLNTMMGAQNDA